MTIRRVVTGLDATGGACFVADEVLSELPVSNTRLSSIWRTDANPLQIPPAVDVVDSFGFPDLGGAWVLCWTVPPMSVAGEDGDAALTPAGELPSGGVHATNSIDVDVILAGRAGFELEDGTEKVLERGDSIVVNGAPHTWHNRGEETLVVMSVIFGADRKSA